MVSLGSLGLGPLGRRDDDVGRKSRKAYYGKNKKRLWAGISSERQEAIYDHVVDEYKPALIESLREVITEQVAEDLRDTIAQEEREKAKVQARQDLADSEPSSQERQAFRTFVKEVELDSRAQAAVASLRAEGQDSRLSWSRRLFNPLGYGLLLGAVPALYYALTFLAGGNPASPIFLAAAATTALTLFTLWRTTAKRHHRLAKERDSKRETMSQYLILAERAKAYRLVHAERLETKEELDKLTNDLVASKEHQDGRFHPDLQDLDKARDSVRHRFITEAPLRILDDDFEQRLEEAIEDAEGDPRAAASKG